MSLPDCPCLFHPIWTVSWKHGCPCVTLCVCHNQPISGHTPLSECIHASIHVFMFIWLPISVWCLVDSYIERYVPLCGSIFVSHSPHYVASTCMECVHAPVHVLMWTWVLNSAPSPIHSYFGSSVWHCLYCSYLFSVPTPCLECVHASVHVFMSTWLPMLAPHHLNSYMKTWVALCGIVCLLHSAYFWSHTFVRMCTCINTCIYIHLTPHFSVMHRG